MRSVERSMVSVSYETPQETRRRLRRVLAEATFRVLSGHWAYHEYPAGPVPQSSADALALVRDEESWSVLEPAQGSEAEVFGVFAFHFPAASDNSGFVGWLASELKDRLGTGVAVLCGYNSAQGGIYDYWLVPGQLLAEAEAHVRSLAAESDGDSPQRTN
ncbi:DUF6196 family protein [Streptomyces sp. NPDC059477]|uniref:DUF6196 family protein n=1 Tax=Streptomyces sp. NPDC059477 TaxID=3346847 RepID=UPI00367A569E